MFSINKKIDVVGLCDATKYKFIQLLKVTGEFTATAFFATFPVTLSAFITAMWTAESWLTSFTSSFNSGELFIYTSSFLAPYIVWRLKEEEKGKILRELCFYLFLYSLLLGAFLFSAIRIEEKIAAQLMVTDETMAKLGISAAITTIIVWYFSIWSNYRPSKSMRDEEQGQQRDLNATVDKIYGANNE
ncbi:hypothetical protein [Ferrimonas balearica]|uniref:hypothetical protein n=1 Tax=Ferrimonas balearica TaxID=44012 RepID=UPI001C93B180|nr:hypothetical protein [Ferrimonas balearica]MBY5980537.1 hypothetical protein [Ferrimonas balearica]